MYKLIGNTPMIKINYRYQSKVKSVYTKLEYFSLTGSIKDRVVDYILENSNVDDQQVLVEATSGNTGISLSALGALKGKSVVIFMPDFVSRERLALMKLYGACVFSFSLAEGGFDRCLSEAKKYALEHNGFLLDQFSNPLNVMCHYETTASEILSKLDKVDAFVSGVGSGGTIMGVGRRIKEKGGKIIALEPLEAPLLKKGITGSHKIEGIGDSFIPEIVDSKLFDDIYLISDEDAINMSRKLAHELGLGVGISSGANLLASILANEKIDGNVVTVFPDDNKKYLSTDLSKDIKGYLLSDQVTLLNYEVL